ncbi:TPA: hypothetical protein SMO11_005379 [Pseudomonas aeruginosa]|uniref:hypothetical protein n=1 Tax=Pseudomonas aeruginosa TaxID=287 RepID=UPI0029E2F4D9|nr:hypothetical protein [Pseudomonas aeruginosa]HCH7766296.1 hypothetical protein [Pseudomonas aeruginosa]HCI3518984.1 hypothetical protein [Pseudomonas aeruginosa]HCI7133459.1 hypothetical protein [Pseudomonas aeruginosa]HCJ0535610.1 hypothetical protein [Pseudomonas aeruginosa]
MSEVKKISPVGNIYGWEESQFGEFVLSQDYDDLAAEAQALREEIKKAQNALAFTEQWYGVRHERLWHWAHAELNEEQKRRYFNIVANGTAEHSEPPTFAQQLCRTKHRYECAEKEVAALRARVVVVPERKLLNAGVPGLNRNSGWNACLDELARLNGKTVSEGLLRRLLDSDGIDGIFDAQQNYAAHQELRALLSEREGGRQ